MIVFGSHHLPLLPFPYHLCFSHTDILIGKYQVSSYAGALNICCSYCSKILIHPSYHIPFTHTPSVLWKYLLFLLLILSSRTQFGDRYWWLSVHWDPLSELSFREFTQFSILNCLSAPACLSPLPLDCKLQEMTDFVSHSLLSYNSV